VKRFIEILAACVGLATAAGFQVQGNMSEAWDKSSLAVRTGEVGAKLWFSLPAHSGITVVAKPDTGATVTSRLNMPATVDLRLPSTYEITITRDSGDGQWTCKDAAGGPVLLGFGTSVDVKRHARVTYVADDEKEIWTFTWPKEATFLVQVPNASGKVTQEQDLYDSNELELVGGGSFTFEVAPTDGSGEFVARKSE
jgi:hypothetical protein